MDIELFKEKAKEFQLDFVEYEITELQACIEVKSDAIKFPDRKLDYQDHKFLIDLIHCHNLSLEKKSVDSVNVTYGQP